MQGRGVGEALAFLAAFASCRIGFEPLGVDAVDATTPQLVLGYQHGCLRAEAGGLICWGLGAQGQLGNGAMADQHSPMPTAPGMTWADVALGQHHTCALDDTGRAWCWGSNSNGQLGLAAPTCGNAFVDPGEQCDDGGTANGDGCSAICELAATAPSHATPQRLPDTRTFRRIYADSFSTYAIAADNTLWSWGRNGANQLGLGGNRDRGRPFQVRIVSPQVGVDDAWARVGAGDDHACALQQDGSLWCWGSDGRGQLGQGGSTIARDSPQVVLGGTSWTAVEAGRDHGCALDRSSQIHCWGRNETGQLGLGDTADRDVPVRLDGAIYDRLDRGLAHGCARRPDRTLWCWGRNTSGQIGDGTVTAMAPSPTAVSGAWLAVSAGSDFSCALDVDEAVWCWGDGANGRTGLGRTSASSVPVRLALP